jgi:hypothetical protein
VPTTADDGSSAVVLILTENGAVGGTGFVAAESGLIATCSHVVQSERDQQRGLPRPNSVKVVFHATGASRPSRVEAEATVVADWWRPVDTDDVAILQVDALPDGVHPARLGSSGGTTGHAVTSFGFPDTGAIEGIPGRGEILGETQQAGARILVGHSSEITQGFSGGHVWDVARRRAIGMVTKITRPDPNARLAEAFFLTPAETLLAICPQLHISDVPPYRELAAFGEADSEFFKGRRAAVNDLVGHLRSNPRFLAVLGPSGSGKSSVVQAGLIPALRNGAVPGSDGWLIVTFRPLNDPLAQLGTTTIGPVASLAEASDRAERAAAARLALVIDQGEELFTDTPQEAARVFLDELATILDERAVTVIFTMRSDFYARLGEYAPRMLRWLETGLANIGDELTRDELTAMVEEPARSVGLSFAPGLVDLIVKDVLDTSSAPGDAPTARVTILPLLEFALTRLWEQRRDGELTFDGYQQIGGITGALTQWADATYTAFDDVDTPVAERVFVDLVHFGDPTVGVPDTRRRRLLDDLAPARDRAVVSRVVDRLAARRLVTTSGGAQSRPLSVEIIHDALIKHWQLLATWMSRERGFRSWVQAIQDQIDDWSAAVNAKRNSEADSVVLRGPQLDEAEGWARSHGADFGDTLGRFIEASRRVKRLEHRRSLQRRWALAGLAAVFVAAFGWIGLSFAQERVALASATGPEIAIAGGQVVLGGDQTSVVMPAFWIDRHEVSIGQYLECMSRGQCTAPRFDVMQPGAEQVPDLPIVGVDARQAAQFCEWLGRRLPSFAEWERAVRGAAYRPWPWGDAEPDASRVNALFGEPVDPHLVAVEDPEFLGGRSVEGVFNLFGNASEWTSTPDGCGPYPCDRPWDLGSTAPVSLLVAGWGMNDHFFFDQAYAPIPAVPGFVDGKTGFRCAHN